MEDKEDPTCITFIPLEKTKKQRRKECRKIFKDIIQDNFPKIKENFNLQIIRNTLFQKKTHKNDNYEDIISKVSGLQR